MRDSRTQLARFRRSVSALLIVAVGLVVAACGAGQSTAPTSTVQVAVPSATSAVPGGAASSTNGAAAAFPPGVGDIAPDFTLPVATGGEITLAQYRGEKPVVLVFYRAFWCTFCRQQLVELQRHYGDIEAAGAEVLAVSTDDLNGAETAVGSFGAGFPILYTSRDSSVPGAYDRFNKFGDGLASAAVYVIDSDGVIRWADLGTSYTHQVPGRQVLDALASLREG